VITKVLSSRRPLAYAAKAIDLHMPCLHPSNSVGHVAGDDGHIKLEGLSLRLLELLSFNIQSKQMYTELV